MIFTVNCDYFLNSINRLTFVVETACFLCGTNYTFIIIILFLFFLCKNKVWSSMTPSGIQTWTDHLRFGLAIFFFSLCLEALCRPFSTSGPSLLYVCFDTFHVDCVFLLTSFPIKPLLEKHTNRQISLLNPQPFPFRKISSYNSIRIVEFTNCITCLIRMMC
jgi:hypothetical protein